MPIHKPNLIFDTSKKTHAEHFLSLGSTFKALKPTPLVSPPEAREAFFQDHDENRRNGTLIQPPSDTVWVLLTFDEKPENQQRYLVYKLRDLDDYEIKT